MKKNFLYLVVFAGMLGLASCSSKGSFESDVRKMADYRCKVKKLEAKDPTDESAKKELDAVMKEMDQYREKMQEKYKGKEDDKEMNEKADKIMEEVMAKCN